MASGEALGSMLGGYRENSIAQQAPHWTTIGAAAGQSPRGPAPRLSATQQERAALIANIQYSLTAGTSLKDRAWAWVHAPRDAAPFEGDSPLYFMLENGLPALREVARLLVRESEPR